MKKLNNNYHRMIRTSQANPGVALSIATIVANNICYWAFTYAAEIHCLNGILSIYGEKVRQNYPELMNINVDVNY